MRWPLVLLVSASLAPLGCRSLSVGHLRAPPGCSLTKGEGVSELIVHVGPHKTGTTTLQKFLVRSKAWLKEAYGADVQMDSAKIISAIPRYLHDHDTHSGPNKCDAEIAKLRNALTQPGARKIISAEGFSKMNSREWDEFLRLLPPNIHVRVVVSHRATADWLRSMWVQLSKYSANPVSFSEAMARFDSNRLQQVDRLRTLESVFGSECVHTVSYEGLREEDQSMETYLVCNVSADLQGSSWSDCRDQIARSVQGAQANPSLRPAEVDVVRLAKAARAKSGDQQMCKEPVVSDFSEQATLSVVAAQLPQACENFGSKYEDVDQEWYRLAGLDAPRAVQSHPVCTVDESKLEDKHWGLLRDAVPGCAPTDARRSQETAEPSCADSSGSGPSEAELWSEVLA